MELYTAPEAGGEPTPNEIHTGADSNHRVHLVRGHSLDRLLEGGGSDYLSLWIPDLTILPVEMLNLYPRGPTAPLHRDRGGGNRVDEGRHVPGRAIHWAPAQIDVAADPNGALRPDGRRIDANGPRIATRRNGGVAQRVNIRMGLNRLKVVGGLEYLRGGRAHTADSKEDSNRKEDNFECGPHGTNRTY